MGMDYTHKGRAPEQVVQFYWTRVRSLATLVTNQLTHSLRHSCLVHLTDVALACEDAKSKLVEAVTVAEVRVGNSLYFVADLGAEVWSQS